MLAILWYIFHSLVTSSIWCGNQGMWGDGSWHLSCYKCPSQLCGTIGGCHKCLQCHLKESQLSRARVIKSQLFQLSHLFGLFMLNKFPFGGFVNHPFLGGHSLRWSVHWAFFCPSPFLCIVVFCLKVLPFCIFPSLVDDIHIIGSTSTIHPAFDHFVFHLASMGSWSNLTNVRLGCFLVDAS